MIYLDNCATTKMRECVAKKIYDYERENFANPSSLHSFGYRVHQDLEDARKNIAEVLKVDKDELYFTSSGTEANNIAIKGAIKRYGRDRKHILVSPIEHSAVWEVMEYFKGLGYEVETLTLNSEGNIDIKALEAKIRKDTFFISVMQVNNEIGTIFPIQEIGDIIKDRDIIFHVDGVQGFMKVATNLKQWGVGLYSASSHKIYGPKGVGLLYVDSSMKIPPLFHGGGQERGLRSSSENVPSIIGFERAISSMQENYDREREYVETLKQRMWEGLSRAEDIEKVSPKVSSPYILSVAFKDVPGEVLLHYLERDEIFISTSSACAAKSSRIKDAINMDLNYAKGFIRMGFSYENTEDEIDIVIQQIIKYVKEIRGIVR